LAGGWLLSEVAAATGISVSFLSQVETGKSGITFMRLVRLVGFYRVSLGDLLIERADWDPLLVRADDRQSVPAAPGVSVSLLSPDTERQMLPQLVALEEGSETAGPVAHRGEEFALVLQGVVEIDFGEARERAALGDGDSAYFDATIPHVYRNVGGGQARIAVVSTPPIHHGQLDLSASGAVSKYQKMR
jgi:transcriptional regulator with XRE-family HTH domain